MKGKIKTLIHLDSLLNGGGGGADTVTYIHLMRHYFNYCSHSLDMPLTLCLCLQVRVCVCVCFEVLRQQVCFISGNASVSLGRILKAPYLL